MEVRRSPMTQDKKKEAAFFDEVAAAQQYNVFTETSNRKLIRTLLEFSGLRPGTRVADLGCGAGTFTKLLQREGFECVGTAT